MRRARLIVKPAATLDVAGAAEWYDQQRPGLSAEFLDELQTAFERIADQPLLYQELQEGVRHATLHRFPYGVYYIVDEEAVFVLAVLHLHRDPGEWQRRR